MLLSRVSLVCLPQHLGYAAGRSGNVCALTLSDAAYSSSGAYQTSCMSTSCDDSHTRWNRAVPDDEEGISDVSVLVVHIVVVQTVIEDGLPETVVETVDERTACGVAGVVKAGLVAGKVDILEEQCRLTQYLLPNMGKHS